MYGGASYGKNEKGVFVIYNNGEAELLGIDVDSFNYIGFVEDYSIGDRGMGASFSTDKDNVYVGCGDILNGEDPDTFNLESYLLKNTPQ